MKKIILILGMIAVTFSCAEDLSEMNVDEKRPAVVPVGSLFANATKNLVDQVTSTNVNQNVYRLFVQHWTETTYLDESRYDILQRNVGDNTFRVFYRDVLRDLRAASDFTVAESAAGEDAVKAKANRLAIIEILNVYTYSMLVDTYGNVPYSEALDPIEHPNPKYDDAKVIYTDLFARLDAAIGNLDDGFDGFDSNVDLLYDGDVAGWRMFANSLKLRMAITIADESTLATLSQTAAEEAVAAGVFTSSADNASLQYFSTQPNTNPLYEDLVTSGRYDFVAAAPLVDAMNALNDPRRPFYYIPVGGVFVGAPYAEAVDDFTLVSSPGDPLDPSLPNTRLLDPTLEGLLMDYTEVEFYLAEAVERGYSVGADAETHYNNAITSSILYWGASAGDAAAYLAQPSVAYTTATGGWRQKIGVQSWIGFYNRGFEAWTSWRRLDYPQLTPADNAVPAADGEIPKRLTYPVLEQTLNGTNYTAAASAIGGDRLKTKLFWDKF